MANHLIIDTETTGLTKPFCYDVGYKIIDDNGQQILRKHFVVEQIWHNLPLFESAYYKEKRQQYVQLMRKHEAIMDKWGYIMRTLHRDIKQNNVIDAYAYNSDFDDGVFTFNCDWFKCNNPLENIPIYDIWGYACRYITYKPEYKLFCEMNELFTDTGNYKQSAEAVYRFIVGDNDFIEEHMGVYDVDIETEILLYCITECGGDYGQNLKAIKTLPRKVNHPYTIKINGNIIYQGEYIKKYVRDDRYYFTEDA